MKKLSLGSSGIQVSAMALGCLPFGSTLDQARSFELLDYYRDQGGQFLDSANNYSFWEPGCQGGESETLLGQWLKARGGRHELVLATKLGAAPRVGREEFFAHAGNPWTELTEGLSAAAITRALEGSLRRLGSDYVDLLYLHVDDRSTRLEESLEALSRLVESGKVRAIACSNFKVWRLAQAHRISAERGWPAFQAYQSFHTYFQTEKGAATGMFDQMGEELFDYVRSGPALSLLAYTPLLWGSYTQEHKYRTLDRLKPFVRPQNQERRARLERVAESSGLSVNQVIYCWMLQSDPPIIPLVAVSRLEQLAENLAAADKTLTAGQLALLNAPLD